MHYIGRRAPPPRPGAAADHFSSSARPGAATARSTRVRSSTMTSRVKTLSDSVIRRLHGGARDRSAFSRFQGVREAIAEPKTRDSHTVVRKTLGSIAQLVERPTRNQEVPRSRPAKATLLGGIDWRIPGWGANPIPIRPRPSAN